MTTITQEILNFIKENDVKFIRLAFCTPFGVQKNISILPGELESAFKDGISFDPSAIEGFSEAGTTDLLLHPDPSAMTILPWRPQPGRVVRFYCDIKSGDGKLSALDSRELLRQAVKRCEKSGYCCKIGVKSEFYLFKTNEQGEYTKETLDKGGYLDIAPLDRGENIRREICFCLEEMGLYPQTSHHERGPGQNEIDFRFSDALDCADHILTFKSMVKAIASRNGLYASFMPKPLAKEPGNSLNINLSLSQNGTNIFKNEEGQHSQAGESFIAGVMEKMPEITLFLNSTVNSYERFAQKDTSDSVSWSHQSRAHMIRIPAAKGEKVRMELRSADSALNPYLAFALLIHAGLDGIEKKIKLAGQGEVTTKLPATFQAAIQTAKESPFLEGVLGEQILRSFIKRKELEQRQFAESEHKERFYEEMYFPYL